jgi:cytoskeletal protein CcmA (bactofilin family)
MFRKTPLNAPNLPAQTERVTSVLGPGINWHGDLHGTGGVRIEGPLEGEINIRGLIVVGETGRVTCQHMKANTIIIAGAVRGSITAEKIEIRSTGRVWGDVVAVSFSTEEVAFLRGQVRMEEKVELNLEPGEDGEQGEGNLDQEMPAGVDDLPSTPEESA